MTKTIDTIPDATLSRIGPNGVEQIPTTDLFGGKKVVLFAVPGAFTPTCSEQHLPGYVEHFSAFVDKGVEVVCIAVNDPFVMHAWGESQQVPRGLHMLADGNAQFVRALGLEMDASRFGMGLRSKRFSLYAENGVIRHLFIDAPGEFKVSSAEHMLQHLG